VECWIPECLKGSGRVIGERGGGAGLGDDLFEQADVVGERASAGGGQGVGGGRAAAFEGFRDGDVTGFEQGSEVGGGVAVRHAEGVADLGEEKAGGGREQGHDGEAPLFVDHAIQLKKGLRVHDDWERDSVAAR